MESRLHTGEYAEIENFIDVILCHRHVATVARAPSWWAANVCSDAHKDRKLLSYSRYRQQIYPTWKLIYGDSSDTERVSSKKVSFLRSLYNVPV